MDRATNTNDEVVPSLARAARRHDRRHTIATNARSTRIRAAVPSRARCVGDVVAGFAAALRDQPQPVDPGGAIERLGGVVQRERRDRRRRERLHLDPGPVVCPDARADRDAAVCGRRRDDDVGAGDADRMAEREELGRLLDAHHPGDPSGLERVTLLRPRDEVLHRVRRHRDDALGDGLAVGLRLVADLDDTSGVLRSPGLRGIGHGAQSSIERKSITGTSVPAAAVSMPTGITARPLARATVENRVEPRPPVGVAIQPCSVRFTRTRANCTFPFGPPTSASSRAVTSGRPTERRPIIFISAGRMNSSNETNTLTGLPGSPKYGMPSMWPNPCGLPGCIATL